MSVRQETGTDGRPARELIPKSEKPQIRKAQRKQPAKDRPATHPHRSLLLPEFRHFAWLNLCYSVVFSRFTAVAAIIGLYWTKTSVNSPCFEFLHPPPLAVTFDCNLRTATSPKLCENLLGARNLPVTTKDLELGDCQPGCAHTNISGLSSHHLSQFMGDVSMDNRSHMDRIV